MRRPFLVPLLLLALPGCRERLTPHRQSATADSAPERLSIGVDYRGPESVRYDSAQDVYFISNVNGGMSAVDSNGYIVRADAADPSRTTVFARSGVGGVTLNGPKGLALAGDTLWVADIDVVRGFDRHTGAPVGLVDLRPYQAQFLNDIAVAPDGSLYVTDTGIVLGPEGRLPAGVGRIFRIGAGHAVTIVAQGDSLEWPNGITWDERMKRWIIAPFHPLVSHVLALDTTGMRSVPIASSQGDFDGVEVWRAGRLLVSSWADSAIYLVGDSGSRRFIRGVPTPADIGIDTRRQVLAIPEPNSDRVEFWRLPGR